MKGEIHLELTIKKVKRGGMVYTDRFQSYNGLVSYDIRHKRIDHRKRFANGIVHINGIEGFWSFARERLMKYHGIDPAKSPFCSKKRELGYNYRDTDRCNQLNATLGEYVRVAVSE